MILPPEATGSPLFLAAIVLGALGAIAILAAIVSLFRRRVLRSLLRLVTGITLLALGALSATLSIGMVGYRALTREELALRVVVLSPGQQRFIVLVAFPDGTDAKYEIAGDEVYVDARILKWHPWANVLGLHTAYELDRIAGRYRDINDERSKPRTVYPLGRERPVDLHGLRRRYALLAPLVDAEYGSGAFVPVEKAREFEVRISPTGLLIRPKP